MSDKYKYIASLPKGSWHFIEVGSCGEVIIICSDRWLNPRLLKHGEIEEIKPEDPNEEATKPTNPS